MHLANENVRRYIVTTNSHCIVYTMSNESGGVYLRFLTLACEGLNLNNKNTGSIRR